MTKTIRSEEKFGIALLIVSALLSMTIVAYAQTEADSAVSASSEASAEAAITFPVAELGNCSSKAECKRYCNDPANMEACTSFAEARGLVNKEEAARARTFTARLKSAGGPGGCTTPEQCKLFCSDLKNLDTCVAFAKEHKLEGEHAKSAERLKAYVASGGTMPGGCTSQEECRKYCANFDHAEECSVFAEKAGLATNKNGIPSGQFQKFVVLAKEGKTPGGCKDKEACEAYCKEEAHFAECTDFRVQVGGLTVEQATRIKESGRKGPGGCNSEEACKAYCNEESHREECLSFAKERGFLSEEKVKTIQDGALRLRQGLENAPAEVAVCLRSTLGTDIIDDVQNGTLAPGPEVGERLKGCFEKFGEKIDPKEAVKRLPPAVASCLRDKLGAEKADQVQSGRVPSTPEIADVLRVCSQAVKLQSASGTVSGGPKVAGVLRSAPPAVTECLKARLGTRFEAVANGGEVGAETEKEVKSCFESFRSEKPANADPARMPEKGTPASANPSKRILECYQKVTGVSEMPETIDSSVRLLVEKCLSGGVEKPAEGRPLNVKPAEPRRVDGGGPVSNSNIPPEVAKCLQANLGVDALVRILGNQAEALDPEVQEVVKKCLMSSRPFETKQVPVVVDGSAGGTVDGAQ